MIARDLSPWARAELSPEMRQRIALAQPLDARLTVVGRPWTARVMWRGECVAETYGHLTADGAVEAVLGWRQEVVA